MSKQAIDASKRPGYGSAENYDKGLSAIGRDHLPIGTKVTPRWLEVQGIPPSDAPPVLYAYRFMGIVDEHDGLTETGLGLAQATGEDKQASLRANVEDSYSDVFHRIKPPHANIQQIREAFRDCQYEPVAMQGKMVSLFRGLCRAAGITLDEDEKSQASRKQIIGTPSSMPSLTDVPLTHDGNEPMAKLPHSPNLNGTTHASSDLSLVKKVVASFAELDQLAKSSDWTEADQAKWLNYVNMSYHMLGNALELIERNEP
jgi:Family of unknown function (DUF5343)